MMRKRADRESSIELGVNATDTGLTLMDWGHDENQPIKQSYTQAVDQAVDQAGDAPLFLPQFAQLRRICRENTEDRLKELEYQLDRQKSHLGHNSQVEEAKALLREYDQNVESEIRRLILQDPAYADEHGLSIAHFACRRSQDEKQQQYVMLSKLWGKKSKTIIDTKPLALQPHEKHQLGKFGDKFGYNPEDIVMRTQRRKHASESLPGAVIYRETGELEIRAPVVFAWKITLWASGIALVVYYGVGIIATNTEFSTLFQEYFFWIAIIWSLSSSALLGWLVHVLSGSKRDVLGAFLSALALWLVVIQIGQTHLLQN